MHYPVPGLPDSHQSKQTGEFILYVNIILYVLQEGKRGHIRAGKFYLINCSIIQNGNEGSTEHRAVGLL